MKNRGKRMVSAIIAMALVVVMSPSMQVSARTVRPVKEGTFVEETGLVNTEVEEIGTGSSDVTKGESKEDVAETACVNLRSGFTTISKSSSGQYDYISICGKENVTYISGACALQDMTTGRVVATWCLRSSNSSVYCTRQYTAVPGHTYVLSCTATLTRVDGYRESVSLCTSRTF